MRFRQIVMAAMEGQGTAMVSDRASETTDSYAVHLRSVEATTLKQDQLPELVPGIFSSQAGKTTLELVDAARLPVQPTEQQSPLSKLEDLKLQNKQLKEEKAQVRRLANEILRVGGPTSDGSDGKSQK